MPSETSPGGPGNDTAHSFVACPCCHERTLERRADFEICPECGWEDDGQDDADAHIVRGGPNGRLSLKQARLDYLEAVAEDGGDSTARGGGGIWQAEARRQAPDLFDI
ncbi:CPCC family cysteine-rich protein [Streptomyces sp. NPDC058195]|uniref:CPCC family cysteine-rich protein n=1 Tax=Streptomyces sp. NPDC058195 TaxID=3346375 RepID=UPI0036E8BD30